MNVFAFGRRNRSRELLLNQVPVMTADEIMEALGSVRRDAPIIRAVQNVLAGIEELAKEQVAIRKMGAEERTFHAGGIAYMADTQQRFAELVEEAERRKG